MEETYDESYVAEMDEETVNQDFDDIDLLGERLEDDDIEETELLFE